jgi:proliferating cell nuclear antigen PCNA
MFKMTLSDSNLIRNSIPIIAEILDEGMFKVDNNGLSLLSPDRSMIAVVNFRLLSSAFDEYKVSGDETLGLNMSNLVSVIKRISNNDKVSISKQDNSNVLEIVLDGNGKRRFEIPLLDVKTEKPPIDQLEFKATAEIDSTILEQGISDADIIDDSIVIEVSPGGFKMWAKGDVSSAQLELPKGGNGLYKIDASEPMKARYPLEYLKKMIKASKLSGKVGISFAQDYPMRIEFKDIDKLSLEFVLAPRVEE